MKKLITIIGIGVLTIINSHAGPSWGFNLSNGSGFYWNGHGRSTQPHVMPRINGRCYDTVVFQGPQYYRVGNVPCNTRIKNYTDAPLVVTPRHGSRVIIPRSWD
jgi:hypothetical protein